MSYSSFGYFFVSLCVLCFFLVPRSLFAQEKKGAHASSLMSTTDFSLHLAADVRDFWWSEEYKKLLIEKFKLREKKAVLDVGCGAGNSTRLLSEFTASDSSIIGVDVDEAILDVAREKSKEQKNISYQESGATALPFEDNTFDFVFCQTVMIHLPDPKKAIQEMKRVLKPGGLLIMAENKYFLFSPEDCEKFFLLSSPDQAEFRKLMAVAQKLNQAYLNQIKAKTLVGSFGAEMLITAGTKKRS